MEPRMKLIWHADHLSERDWLAFIFGDLVQEEITDLGLTRFDDNSIHVISSNWAPLASYTDYFRQCRIRCKRVVLVHISDEWFSGGYQLYQHFDLVIRWNHSWLTRHPGIVTVPLGYFNDTGSSDRPANQRRHVWSFVGEIKSSRIAMAAALDSLEPKFITRVDSVSNPNGRRLSKAEFNAVLEDTVFSPCPMGNATIDTSRVYESLEMGCIPLVELRFSLDYYKNLLGPNPLPAFHDWRAARQFVERLIRDKPALLAKQTEIMGWWKAYKYRMRTEVREAINGPSRAQELRRFSGLVRNRLPLVHEPLRIVEILRHQSAGSLSRRLVRPIGPLKRILRDGLSLQSRSTS
jgi:hypothetical protein